jgi:hypothetical protein
MFERFAAKPRSVSGMHMLYASGDLPDGASTTLLMASRRKCEQDGRTFNCCKYFSLMMSLDPLRGW